MSLLDGGAKNGQMEFFIWLQKIICLIIQ